MEAVAQAVLDGFFYILQLSCRSHSDWMNPTSHGILF